MKHTRYILPLLFFGLSILSGWAQQGQERGKRMKFDILIQGAHVFDGISKDSSLLDVGIKGERIVFVGKATRRHKGKKEIDGRGLYLAPGFIDPHTHYSRQLGHRTRDERAVLRALKQGVTTVFEGNDGSGPWPIGQTLEDWEQQGIGPNAALFVGHNTVRREVLGSRDIQPGPKETLAMENMVDRAMREGAFGISTGLFYTPGNYATIEEVIGLAKVAASHGGIYDTHQRDEGSQSIGVLASTQEVLDIAEAAGIPAHISHIKVSGPQAWGKSGELIQMIEEAQKKGLKVTANQYPYGASRTGLSSALVPPWARDGGTKAMRERFGDPHLRDSILMGIAKNIGARTADPAKLVLSSGDKALNGKSLQDLSLAWGISPEEAVLRVCSESQPSVHSFMMQDADIENFMVQPWVMTGSDGGSGHPRAFGSFVRKIQKYGLEKNVLSVAGAINSSTFLTAQTLQIKDRGAIREGFYADLVLFDPQTIRENGSYDQGEVLASGITHVLVNGVPVIESGSWKGKLSGKALKLNAQ